jgi:hypothetical protein
MTTIVQPRLVVESQGLDDKDGTVPSPHRISPPHGTTVRFLLKILGKRSPVGEDPTVLPILLKEGRNFLEAVPWREAGARKAAWEL